jgi:hypothetical protein
VGAAIFKSQKNQGSSMRNVLHGGAGNKPKHSQNINTNNPNID